MNVLSDVTVKPSPDAIDMQRSKLRTLSYTV